MCFLNRFLIIALIFFEIEVGMLGVNRISYFSFRLFVAILAVLNASIRPFLLILLLKINIYNVAITAFILNAIIFYIASQYYLGIHIVSFTSGLCAFLIIWIASTITNRYIYIQPNQL